MCKLGYPVSRLFTRGSGEEDKNVRGEGKEQGSEKEVGRGGGEESEQSLHVVILLSCNYLSDHLSTRLISWLQKTGM